MRRLRAGGRCGRFGGMSALNAPPPRSPEELRPLLHQKLDSASDEEVLAVHRLLLKMEARRLADELGAAMQEEWNSGRITEESIAEAILEHRRKHPYR